MLTNSDAILFGFIALIIAEVILFVKKVPLARNFLIGSFILYISLIFSITLFPIVFQEIGFDYEYNFVPFKTIIASLKSFSTYSLLTLVGNIVMLLPFGFYVSASSKYSAAKGIVIILSFAFFIETMQLVIGLIIGYRYRCVDIDDFILNSIGGILGLIIYKKIPQKLKLFFSE